MNDVKNNHRVFPIIFLAIIIGVFIYFFVPFNQTLDMKEVDRIFLEDQGYHYYYKQLSENEQKNYRILYYNLKSYDNEVSLENTKVSQVEKIYQAIMNDHPEFYYFKGTFQYKNDNHYLTIMPKYEMSETEVKEYNQKIEDYTQEIIQKAKSKDNKKDQVKVIYEYLIHTIDYQEGKNDQNMLSAIIEKKTVCAGYAKAYQYLLEQLDIESACLTGKTREDDKNTQEGEGHAWVMIHLDDDFYYSDPTWGDVDDDGVGHTCYAYFLMNSNDMLNCYSPDGQYEETKENKINYFKDIDCYMNEYQKDMLSRAVKNALQNNQRVAEIKCTNDSVYRKVKSLLQNTYLGYYVLSENHCYSEKSTYYCKDELKLIELYF